MSPSGSDASVTLWIDELKQGDRAAADKLWERYYRILVGLARRKLDGTNRGPADEEDVVQQAFDAFFRAAEAGRLPQLHDRDDLWALLVKITENKARDQRKNQRRLKRGGGQVVRGDSVFAAGGSSDVVAGLDRAPSPEPTPEFALQAVEQCRRLLDRLPDEQLRQIALMKLEGYSRDEIARQFGCVPDTIGRKLRRIRSEWKVEYDDGT